MRTELVILMAICALTASVHGQGGDFESSCARNSDCDTRAALVCRGGKCACKDPKDHDYDYETKRCYATSGGTCSTTGIYEPICWPHNMTCTNNVCRCDPPHVPGFLGFCGLPRGEKCNNGGDCLGWLMCVEGKCECPYTQEYSEEHKSCVIRAGYSCSATSNPCTENSECKKDEKNEDKCICRNGYERDSNRRCSGLLGTGCGDKRPCYEEGYLQCGAGNSCVCKTGYIRENSLDKTCKGKLDWPCTKKEDCITGATCSYQRCFCHEASADRTVCYAMHGEECNDKVVCSQSRHLGCTGKKCACKSPGDQIYDKSKNRCLAKAGKICGPSASNIECGANSQCENGRCECNSGHKANGNGECIKSGDGGSGGGGGGAGSLVASTVLIGTAMMWHGRLI